MGGLNPFSTQGDSQIVHFYQELCGSDEEAAQDVSQCPDLFPPLAVMAALRERCSTHIGGAARLRIKECDRINAVVEMLRKFGLAVEEFADGISLVGKNQLRGDVVIDSHNDHRIAMAAAIAATVCKNPVTICGAESVNKSYPQFWAEYRALGGQYE
jgi:3-phosphoshikimate 1-carboxyvinyltransferase